MFEMIETPKFLYTITIPLTIPEVNQIVAALCRRVEMMEGLAAVEENPARKQTLETEVKVIRHAIDKIRDTECTRGPLNDENTPTYEWTYYPEHSKKVRVKA